MYHKAASREPQSQSDSSPKAPATTPIISANAPQRVTVALCQLKVGDDKLANLKAAEKAIIEAKLQGAQLVVLPV